MKHNNQKQAPFHVKHMRMKDSIIKCRQIIDNFELLSSRLKKHNYKIDVIAEDNQVTRKKYQQSGGNIINEHDLLNNRISYFSQGQVKDMIKLFRSKRCKDMTSQMSQNGLAVKKIDSWEYSNIKRIKTDFDQSRERSVQVRKEQSESKKQAHFQHIFAKRRFKKVEGTIQRKLFVRSIKAPATGQNKMLPVVSSHKKLSSQAVTVLEYSLESPSQITLSKKASQSSTRYQSSPNKMYLYKKLQNMHQQSKLIFNPIYERRIKSYTEFLWKIMLAHNVYSNIDFNSKQICKHKMKVYVGPGNNCNMIKGLLKRRFWWMVVEEYSEDCMFVWTQLKNNKIFMKQTSAPENRIKLIEDDEKICKIQKKSKLNKKEKKKLLADYASHRKIWNEVDFSQMKNYIIENELANRDEEGLSTTKQESFLNRTKYVTSQVKQLTLLNNPKQLDSISQSNVVLPSKAVIHNHLQNNFHLGNKKALFYNLKVYYLKIGQNPFDFIPLTFHIKNGTKDIQYKRFVKFYQQRKEKIKKEEEEHGHGKTRNIWIVKPGENTNRGNGITVIDQIYELTNILKRKGSQRCHTVGDNHSKNKIYKEKDLESGSKTFIVQMYIDRPFLYYDRKFDLRHFMLITNLHGVTRVYWYEEGYIRTSSYLFNVHNFEPEIHLTNDAIQKNYSDYGKFEPSNKISYGEFQSYLNTFTDKRVNFKQDVLPKMKQIATDAAKSVFSRMNPNQQMHNFQIFGLDYMLDKNCKPWLIEINTNPCLDCSCPLLNRIIPYMIEQSLKLSLDVVYPPPSHYPNTCKHYAPFISLESFKYELIFDSLTQGDALMATLDKFYHDIDKQIGQIDEDEQFKDNGAQIKLEDYT